MAPSYPSIQSFYKRESAAIQSSGSAPSASSEGDGNGFTEQELSEALDPLTRKWNPDREYEELSIARLVPGPKAVTFMGRIVNFNTYVGQSAKQPKAKGCHYAVVQDGSGAIAVGLLDLV